MINIISGFYNLFSFGKQERCLIHLLPNKIIMHSFKFLSFIELNNFYNALIINSKIKQPEIKENSKKLFELIKLELSNRNYYKLLLDNLEEKVFRDHVKNKQIIKVINES